MELIRLNKYLVQAGVCSRREADRLIEQGKILVNGVAAGLGQKVDGSEQIVVNGKVVAKKQIKPVYLAYNKPVGIICTADPKAKDNIITAVNYPERVFTIGRLDVASAGLILLTNDGEVANQITSVAGQHEKEYVITLEQPVTPEFLHTMATGVELADGITLPAKVTKLGHAIFSITIVEGRNRQLRRMCEKLNVQIKALTRIRIMNIKLGDLPTGQWRLLTPQEITDLLGQLKPE
jgi:23S rRNA pseudouridine2604 synthase